MGIGGENGTRAGDHGGAGMAPEAPERVGRGGGVLLAVVHWPKESRGKANPGQNWIQIEKVGHKRQK